MLEDNLRVPSGVSYMIANRRAVKSNLRRLYRRCHVREVENYGQLLRDTLIELVPEGHPEPCLALLTPGIYNSAYYEHLFLAREIGADLVEGRDLLIRDGHVYMRTTEGLRHIDVIYRRVDDDFLDPEVFRPDSMLGVPGLMEAAYRLGNVALANVPTRLCRRPEDLEFTLDNLEDLIVKRVGDRSCCGDGRPGSCRARSAAWRSAAAVSW